MTDISPLHPLGRLPHRGANSSFSSRSSRGMSANSDWSAAARFAHYVKRPLERLLPFVFAAAVTGALAFGWITREEQHLSPEEGIGYWLGIVGAATMLMLLLYPLRKRFKSLRHLGSVKTWFRAHMLMGILGPTLILFHANFTLNSLNATVATLAMLVVVMSGLIGRYLYARIHMGLYGQRAETQQLLADLAALKSVLGTDTGGNEAFARELAALEGCLPNLNAGAVATAWQIFRIGPRSRRIVRRLTTLADDAIRLGAKRYGWSRRMRRERMALVREHLTVFRAAILKTATLAFYTRLFSLWHHLHLPLFVVLIGAAILHVVAVHLY